MNEEQRAAGFPILKEARKLNLPALRAAGWPNAQASKAARAARLLRDVQAANMRKLAKDPTYVPQPRLEPIPRREQSCVPTIPCPKSGCQKLYKNERSLKYHLHRDDPSFSAETPYKCEHDGCGNILRDRAQGERSLSPSSSRYSVCMARVRKRFERRFESETPPSRATRHHQGQRAC
jgi:hypothetical protein